jgi:hypothetical protein
MKHLRLPNIYDSDELSSQNSLSTPEESLTRPEFAQDSDINVIVRRFGVVTDPITSGQWISNADVYDLANDYQSALAVITQAQEQFNTLAPDVRLRFNNDPAYFVQYASDPSNIDDLRKLGLAPMRSPEAVENAASSLPLPGV